MDTFLPPIEKPAGLTMKLVYYFTRKQFGKVLMPLKVYSSRMPTAFGMFLGKISSLDKKLVLKPELAMLVRERVAHLNICLFCIDIGRYYAIKSGTMNEAKFDTLNDYNNSSAFSAAEKAALDYVTELTNKKVSPETFNKLKSYYTEREICDIVWLVASEHVYNITNIGLNIHSDMLCDISKN